jgi:hypothetical protein
MSTMLAMLILMPLLASGFQLTCESMPPELKESDLPKTVECINLDTTDDGITTGRWSCWSKELLGSPYYIDVAYITCPGSECELVYRIGRITTLEIVQGVFVCILCIVILVIIVLFLASLGETKKNYY